MDNSKESKTRRRVGGFFWPILLIAAGVVILLNNAGQLSGEMWRLIFNLWPLIFILMALDGILKREGVVGSTLVIGLGILFLLSNFGVLALNVWAVLLQLWPLFLVAFGFDILFGRRSWLASLAGALVILLILFGALFMLGVNLERGQLASAQVHQALEPGVTEAKVTLEPGAGDLRLRKITEPIALIMGSIPDLDQLKITESYSLSNNQADYALRIMGGSFNFTTDTQAYTWDLELTMEIPIDLHVSMGAGKLDLNLTELNLSALNAQLAVGQTTITLPATSSFSGSIENAIGQIEIIIPEGVELVIEIDKGLSTVQLGNGIVKDGNVYSTGAGAKNRITLKVSQAIGTIFLKRQ